MACAALYNYRVINATHPDQPTADHPVFRSPLRKGRHEVCRRSLVRDGRSAADAHRAEHLETSCSVLHDGPKGRRPVEPIDLWALEARSLAVNRREGRRARSRTPRALRQSRPTPPADEHDGRLRWQDVRITFDQEVSRFGFRDSS